MFMAPVFSRRELFSLSKIIFSFWFSGLLVTLVSVSVDLPSDRLGIVMAFAIEFFIGYLIGFCADLVVSVMEFAGALMDTQAGLSVASLLDPSSGRNITLISLILKWVALMAFLQIDGHHLVLSTLVQSYKVLPIGMTVNLAAGAFELVKTGSYVMMMGVQLAMPILLVVFLIDFGMGMMNKISEQINVFQLGFQVKPTISLIIFLATAPGIVGSTSIIMGHSVDVLVQLLNALQSPVIVG